MAQTVRRLPTARETWVQSLGQEDLLEKEMATHPSILAWRIPRTEEPGGIQSMGSQRVGHNWVTSLSFFLYPEIDHRGETISLPLRSRLGQRHEVTKLRGRQRVTERLEEFSAQEWCGEGGSECAVLKQLWSGGDQWRRAAISKFLDTLPIRKSS